MTKTLIFYKPEYIDLARDLRDNCLAHDHHVDIRSGFTNRCPVSDVYYTDRQKQEPGKEEK